MLLNKLSKECFENAKAKGFHSLTEENKDFVIPRDLMLFEAYIKDRFEDEIADTFIRLFHLCGLLNIDIDAHVKLKMEYNKTREHKHGKRF